MTPEALDLIFGVVSAGGLAVLYGARARARREAAREATARRDARWEARTRYERGQAVVEVVRVARWGRHEVVVDTDNNCDVIPEENVEQVTSAQIEAGVRANQRNMRS
jgi:hypothetical protein